MKPSTRDIHHALRSIENAERDPSHPRALARKAIAEWRSNAQREGLPTTNTHDDKGARVLPVDDVLKWEPQHIGRK